MTTITAAATYPINAGGFNTPAGQVAYGGTAYSGTFIPAVWSGKLAQSLRLSRFVHSTGRYSLVYRRENY